MYISFYEIARILKGFIETEKPKSILFVGDDNEGYERYTKSLSYSVGKINTHKTQIDNLPPDEKYDMVFAYEDMNNIND